MAKNTNGTECSNQGVVVRKRGAGHCCWRSLVRVGVLALVVCSSGAWAGTTERVSVDSAGAQGNNSSINASISGDGRYVLFESSATNLVPIDNNGLLSDVFVRDRVAGLIELVSVDSVGTQGNNHSWLASISADGRYVAFTSTSTNLVPDDTNNRGDVFVHDRSTSLTELVSADSTGAQGNGEASLPSISADGRYVAFNSTSTNLVPGDTNGWTDVFVHDRNTGLSERVSVDSGGTQGNNSSVNSNISADGRYVAFESGASNLVLDDTNNSVDLFVHDRDTGLTERVSVASDDAQANNNSRQASISADGRFVAFHSAASNLVPGDTNSNSDVFLHDRGLSVPLVGCVGFDTPMASYPVKAKKNRVFPLKMELFDDLGFEMTDLDLSAPPVVEVIFTAVGGEPIDVSDEALPAGAGSEGNQFVFTDDDIWQFNLKSNNYTAEGSYAVTAVSGDASTYLIDPTCVTSFVIE